MNRDDITRMWEKANGWSPAELDETVKELERFANLVAAMEREACAKVVEEWLHGEWHNQGVVAALMIRARGQA